MIAMDVIRPALPLGITAIAVEHDEQMVNVFVGAVSEGVLIGTVHVSTAGTVRAIREDDEDWVIEPDAAAAVARLLA